MKTFEQFNESKGLPTMVDLIKTAYGKVGTSDVYVARDEEDDKNFHYYVTDTDVDDATNAEKSLTDAGVLGDYVNFELVNLTPRVFAALKSMGFEPSNEPEFVMKVSVSKKHPTGIFLN